MNGIVDFVVLKGYRVCQGKGSTTVMLSDNRLNEKYINLSEKDKKAKEYKI